MLFKSFILRKLNVLILTENCLTWSEIMRTGFLNATLGWARKALYKIPLSLLFYVYFPGIREAEYFVRFAESFLKPLRPLHSEEEVKDFISKQDVSITTKLHLLYNHKNRTRGVK